jgi:DNA-binding NarL/FixJ family response regulator
MTHKEPPLSSPAATEAQRARVGVALGSPLLALGLISILEDALPVDAFAVSLDEIADHHLTAILIDGHCVLEDLCAAVTRLRKRFPQLKIVALGWPLNPDDVRKVIGAGAKGYLLDTSGEAEIRMAFEVILDGSIWAPRKVLAKLVEQGTTQAEAAASAEQPSEELSARELEVMNLLMSGRSNREIAAALGIEPATVKAHLGRMLRKTHSKNRLEMTLRLVEHQLAKPQG